MPYRDPFTGRFTTERKYERAVARLVRQFERAREKQDRDKMRELRERAKRHAIKLPQKARPKPPPPPPPPPPPDAFREWEFGTRYDKRNHEVNINVRLRFRDPVTEEEARRAMARLIRSGEAPPGVRIDAVDWQRPGKRLRHGGEGDFEAFRTIFYTEGADWLRAGAPKPYEL